MNIEVFSIGSIEEKSLHHFVMSLWAVFDRGLWIGIERIERRIIEMRTALDFCPLRKMLRASRPNIAQLPVETVIRQREQCLGFPIRIVRKKGAILSTQMHMTKKPDAR